VWVGVKIKVLVRLVALFTSNLFLNSAQASKTSTSYKKGWNLIVDSSREELFKTGFQRILGATGLPVKWKADGYCHWLISSGNVRTNATNMDDFYKGCSSATMTLRLN